MHKDINRFKIAANIFKIDRNIALGPAYFYLIKGEVTEEALLNINNGLKYDPNAPDLLKASMLYSFRLGKQNEALDAFNKLASLVPNNEMVKCLSKEGCFSNFPTKGYLK